LFYLVAVCVHARNVSGLFCVGQWLQNTPHPQIHHNLIGLANKPLSQTTIDFYTNATKKYSLAKRGIDYKNPFDQGLRKNLARVFGNGPLYSHLWPNYALPAAPMYAFEYGGGSGESDYCIV